MMDIGGSSAYDLCPTPSLYLVAKCRRRVVLSLAVVRWRGSSDYSAHLQIRQGQRGQQRETGLQLALALWLWLWHFGTALAPPAP